MERRNFIKSMSGFLGLLVVSFIPVEYSKGYTVKEDFELLQFWAVENPVNSACYFNRGANKIYAKQGSQKTNFLMRGYNDRRN